VLRALAGPSRIPLGERTTVSWGNEDLPAKAADKRFYRISGVIGSGKTHLVKHFVVGALHCTFRNSRI
jgi:tRNA A37 threonylcarbamoyladenosine biosynthesis protein TsaE